MSDKSTMKCIAHVWNETNLWR